jgi:predicted ABC-type transport system involved in lysophospholipase L1 biosynthesis ATPase subunit
MIPSSETSASAIEFVAVSCSRAGDDGKAPDELRHIDAAFSARSFTFVTGGSIGERALFLRLASLTETPDSGDVLLAGAPTRELAPEARAELRARKLGLVFSSPFLLPSFTAIENIAVPLFKLEQMAPEEARQRAEEALAFAGLAGFEQARGEELTSFQQHCASLARALAAQPTALLVEELDSLLTANALSDFCVLLRQAAERFGIAVIATGARDLETTGPTRRLVLGTETGGLVEAVAMRPPPCS